MIYPKYSKEVASDTTLATLTNANLKGSSRMGRRGYFIWLLISCIFCIVCVLIGGALAVEISGIGWGIMLIGMIYPIIFLLRAENARLRDINFSSSQLRFTMGISIILAILYWPGVIFFEFLATLSTIWLIFLFILCFIPGTPGPNRYGDVPGFSLRMWQKSK